MPDFGLVERLSVPVVPRLRCGATPICRGAVACVALLAELAGQRDAPSPTVAYPYTDNWVKVSSTRLRNNSGS